MQGPRNIRREDTCKPASKVFIWPKHLSSAKRAGYKLESNKSKKKRTDKNEEVKVDNEVELKMHMVTVKDDDIAIDDIPLATKPPVIVEYKLIREGIIGYY
ncbi:hypothetical protein Tco_0397974 [Tanacetum coccineum]